MSIATSNFADITTRRASRTLSRRSFASTLIAGFHVVFPERVRRYTDPATMLTDGFDEADPQYLAALAFMAQEGHPDDFKIGRRAGAPTQTFTFVPSTPTEDEVFAITMGGVEFSIAAAAGDGVDDVIDDLFALMSLDVDSVILVLASSASEQVFDAEADFTGVFGQTPDPPRNVTITTAAHADWLATVAVVVGRDETGLIISDTIAIDVGGGTTNGTAKVFASIISITIPVQGAAAGTGTIGTGVIFAPDALVFTPTDNTTNLEVAMDVAGAWVGMSATANITLNDDTAEPGVTLATDLAAMRAEDADWYGLIVADAQSHDQILATAVYAETQEIMYFPHTADSDCEESVASDILSVLAAASYFRTNAFYSRVNHGAFPEAAHVGMFLPWAPGQASQEFKALTGIVADDISATAYTNLVGTKTSPSGSKRATVYVEILAPGTNVGTPMTAGGMVSGGEWADIIIGLDYTDSVMSGRIINLQLASPRIPFTQAGIDVFVNSVRGTLVTVSKAPNNLFVLDSITLEWTDIEDVSVEDKAARYYDGVRWDATVQGAIRVIKVVGTVRP